MLRPPFRTQVVLCSYCLPLFFLVGCVRERTLFEAFAVGQSGEAGDAGAAGSNRGGTGGVSGTNATGGVGGASGTDAMGGVGGMGAMSGGVGGTDAKGGVGGANEPSGGMGIAGETVAGAPGTAGASGAGASAGGAGASAGGVGALEPWTESSCEKSLVTGKSGDPCAGVFKCYKTVDCCNTNAYCDGKVLKVDTPCSCPVTCTTDFECGSKLLCENYRCRSCPTASCPETWTVVVRNDCPVCVPPSECKAIGDPICGQLSCVAGQSCLPSCKADPACCFGNRCVESSCSTLKELDCLVVGCPAGSLCSVAGPAVDCKCQPSSGTFTCMGNRVNQCNPY